MIEEVGRGHLPAEPRLLVEQQFLGQSGAENVDARTLDYTFARSSEPAGFGGGERRGIEPSAQRPLAAGQVRIPQDVRADGDRSGRSRIGEVDPYRVIAGPEGREE